MNNTKKDYWIIEFNETDSKMKNYSNKIVTTELIDEIESLDKKLYNSQDGYYKFYFDHIIDDEVVNHIRIDIGCEEIESKSFFNYLKNELQFLAEKENDKELKETILKTLEEKEILDYKIYSQNLNKRNLVNSNLKNNLDNIKSNVISKIIDNKEFNVFEEVYEEVWDNTRNLWIDTQFDYMNVFSEEIQDYLKEVGSLTITDNFELNYLGLIGFERYINNTILENEKDFYKELQLEILKESIRNDEIKIDSEETLDKLLDYVEENLEGHWLLDSKINIQDYKELKSNLIEFKETMIDEIFENDLEIDEELEL